jgi:hypothetical protein
MSTSNDENVIPSNILISPSQSINSTFTNSSSSTLSNSSVNQQNPPAILQTSFVSLSKNSTFVSSNNNSSIISSNNNYPLAVSSSGSTSSSLPAPIQQTTIDYDMSLPLDTTSYVQRQPCPLSPIAQSSSPHQTSLIEEKEETNKNRRDSTDICRIFHNLSSLIDEC